MCYQVAILKSSILISFYPQTKMVYAEKVEERGWGGFLPQENLCAITKYSSVFMFWFKCRKPI